MKKSFQNELCYEPMDIVYTWVNGSDPIHEQNLRKWKQIYEPKAEHSTAATLQTKNETSSKIANTNNNNDVVGSNRFRDNDELRYSLRSLERFAGWVRNIYIVTNGQVPNWLDITNPKIHIIKHEDIFLDKSHLPTFSSPAIESHLHRIPGLSSKFIYLNDDVFFGNDVYPEDFYTISEGQKVFLSWDVPDCSPGCGASWIGDGYCDTACNTTACDYDGGDCLGSSSTQSSRSSWSSWSSSYTNSANSGNNYYSSYYSSDKENRCAERCPTTWLADQFCDSPCNTKECGFDSGDCGVDKVSKELPEWKITKETKYLKIKFNTPSMYLNLTQIFPKSRSVIKDGKTDNYSLLKNAVEEETEEEDEKQSSSAWFNYSKKDKKKAEQYARSSTILQDHKVLIYTFKKMNESEKLPHIMRVVINGTVTSGSEAQNIQQEFYMELMTKADSDKLFKNSEASIIEDLSLERLELLKQLATTSSNQTSVDEVPSASKKATKDTKESEKSTRTTSTTTSENTTTQNKEQRDSDKIEETSTKDEENSVSDDTTSSSKTKEIPLEEEFGRVKDVEDLEHNSQNEIQVQEHKMLEDDLDEQSMKETIEDLQPFLQEDKKKKKKNDKDRSSTGEEPQIEYDSATKQFKEVTKTKTGKKDKVGVTEDGKTTTDVPTSGKKNKAFDEEFSKFLNNIRNQQKQQNNSHKRKLLTVFPQTIKILKQSEDGNSIKYSNKAHLQDQMDHLREFEYKKAKQLQKLEHAKEEDQFTQETEGAFSLISPHAVIHKRKLLDKFGDSLIHVNKLLNREYGRLARKVPAHMPHMIQRDVMAEVYDKWSYYFNVSSSNRFRSSNDMQYAFTYFYYVMHEPIRYNARDYFDKELDRNGDGVLDDYESQYLSLLLKNKRVTAKSLDDLIHTTYNTTRPETNTTATTSSSSSSRSYRFSWGSDDDDFSAKTDYQELMELHAKVKEELYRFVNKSQLLPSYDAFAQSVLNKLCNKHFNHTDNKYKYELKNLDEVGFHMIRDSMEKVQEQLDDLRLKRPKFICLNDDMNKTKPNEKVMEVLHNFYNWYFPKRSQFELPEGKVNPILYIDELKQFIHQNKVSQFYYYATRAAIILLIISVLYYCYEKCCTCCSKNKKKPHMTKKLSTDNFTNDPVSQKTQPQQQQVVIQQRHLFQQSNSNYLDESDLKLV